MRLRTRLALVAAIALCPLPAGAQTVDTHDNRTPSGVLRDGVLRVALWAGSGRWHPMGPGSGGFTVAALGEEGHALSVPAPLIRAPQGVAVEISLRNTLPATLTLHGLCDRPGACTPLTVAAGATALTRFTLGSAGTFHYWASTSSSSSLESRRATDTQTGGAIIVDPVGGAPDDRVFVLGLMPDAEGGQELTFVNGRSWPHTERLSYTVGDHARWRLINLTAEAHAMHLHGFYFTIDSIGDGVSDTAYGPGETRQAVTEQIMPGRTTSISWVPEREGNWLFHCHMLVHMMSTDRSHGSAGAHAPTADAAGMSGLVLGVRVEGRGTPAASEPSAAPRRRFELSVNYDNRHAPTPSYRVGLTEAGAEAPRVNERAAPGPVMVLYAGEPVAVEIINRLREPTAIHWHGIELESFDDGVPGFGGARGSVTPPVAPEGRFTARFTPARAGTFIYHTHWHDADQLAGGIYGPIIVLGKDETYDPRRDHLIVIGLDGVYRPRPDEPFAVNGETRPRALRLEAGVSHRLRFINITADNVAITVQLVSKFDPLRWTLVAKDGSPTPAPQRTPRPSRQLVSVGETYDFELPPLPATPVGLWLELRRGNGELLMQWPVRVE